MSKAIILSYTAAKRYEQCGERQRAWTQKLVKKAIDETPFFKGRCFHNALEWWLLHDDSPNMDVLFVHYWTTDEPTTALFWKPGEREKHYADGIEVCRVAQAELERIGLRHMELEVEQKDSTMLGSGIGMFAMADIIAWNRPQKSVFVVEAKSGTSYDPKQSDWYAAVFAREKFPPDFDVYSIPLRPAVKPDVKARPVTLEDRSVQVERARGIATAMRNGEWPVKPGTACSWCEARTFCSDYQAKFGHMNGKGKVGVG